MIGVFVWVFFCGLTIGWLYRRSRDQAQRIEHLETVLCDLLDRTGAADPVELTVALGALRRGDCGPVVLHKGPEREVKP